LGGVFAIQREHFTLALMGGIFSIPSIIGIVGLILVVMSKDEFSQPEFLLETGILLCQDVQILFIMPSSGS